MSITPYTIAIPQADLDDLKARLAHVRWTNELPGVDTDYGVPLDSVKRLVKYWQEGYDWRTWEAKLNAYPQFTTTIDGQNIHFLHVRSQEDNALPLILTHGWPMSVLDYLDLIDPLIDPRSHGGEASQAFHLVIPSLPGFGFSGPTTERGWDRFRVARAWAELMRRLGYDRYGAHGMDWGSIISPEVGRFDPSHVIGVHVTEIFSFPSGDPAELEALSEQEKKQLQSFQWWIENKGAYDRGNHFATQTAPDLLINDIRNFFQKLGARSFGNWCESRALSSFRTDSMGHGQGKPALHGVRYRRDRYCSLDQSLHVGFLIGGFDADRDRGGSG